ncbi:MAG: sigma-70 family RNA polymerase sigma factor [Lachnospiraceae bacterium]|nr:sigma-70 family RNA polymerase sigma factor [Lachnospiraceae bacterium]
MDDNEIVELYLSRNEEAIARTKEKYGERLKIIANNILNDIETAKECENDMYLKAWNLIPPNEPRKYLFAFLGKIIRHLAIDVLRKNSRQKRDAVVTELTLEMAECIPTQNGTEQEFEANFLAGLIDKFLEGYPKEQQNVFVRRYWYFDPISEICERYGLSQSKVKSILFRMREKLKKYLEKEGFTV